MDGYETILINNIPYQTTNYSKNGDFYIVDIEDENMNYEVLKELRRQPQFSFYLNDDFKNHSVWLIQFSKTGESSYQLVFKTHSLEWTTQAITSNIENLNEKIEDLAMKIGGSL